MGQVHALRRLSLDFAPTLLRSLCCLGEPSGFSGGVGGAGGGGQEDSCAASVMPAADVARPHSSEAASMSSGTTEAWQKREGREGGGGLSETKQNVDVSACKR